MGRLNDNFFGKETAKPPQDLDDTRLSTENSKTGRKTKFSICNNAFASSNFFLTDVIPYQNHYHESDTRNFKEKCQDYTKGWSKQIREDPSLQKWIKKNESHRY
jgi:hypothetical protein